MPYNNVYTPTKRSTLLGGGGTQVMLVHASGLGMLQRNCGVHSCGIRNHLELRWSCELSNPRYRCCELSTPRYLCCELSTPRHQLVCNWYPAPSGGLPVRTWPGTIQGSVRST